MSTLIVALFAVMIILAAVFHWWARPLTDRIASAVRPLVTLLNNKYYVDELYQKIIVIPLRLLGYVCYLFDMLIIDGIVDNLPALPTLTGWIQRPMQNGRLQGFAAAMAFGLLIVLAIVAYAALR